MAWLGLGSAVRRAEAVAVRREKGAEGERATALLLAPLQSRGWWIGYSRALPGSRADLDAVLVSPCGTAIVVLDSKQWRRNWPTALVAGRVYCGSENRHDQVEKVARYAARVSAALALPGVVVWPLLVVHGSPVAGGYLAVRTEAWSGPTYLLEPERLLPTLANAPKQHDPARARLLAARVHQLLPPYVQHGQGGRR
jgi:hypothetical protein